jgi:hypothetical protein
LSVDCAGREGLEGKCSDLPVLFMVSMVNAIAATILAVTRFSAGDEMPFGLGAAKSLKPQLPE